MSNHNLPHLNPFEDPSIVEGYEAWYSTMGQRADRLEKALLEWLIAKFPEARSILEVGCGTGHFTRWFQACGLQSVGLDLSYAMLVEARRHGIPTCVQGDAHHLPFVEHSFDIVAWITTLEFLQDPLMALREARRVARRGLILGAINRQSWVGREYRRQGGPIWERAQFFTPRELVQWLQQSNGESSKPFWKTTLWRLWPWALPLPWGGFIGMGLRLD